MLSDSWVDWFYFRTTGYSEESRCCCRAPLQPDGESSSHHVTAPPAATERSLLARVCDTVGAALFSALGTMAVCQTCCHDNDHTRSDNRQGTCTNVPLKGKINRVKDKITSLNSHWSSRLDLDLDWLWALWRYCRRLTFCCSWDPISLTEVTQWGAKRFPEDGRFDTQFFEQDTSS